MTFNWAFVWMTAPLMAQNAIVLVASETGSTLQPGILDPGIVQ